MAAEPIDVGLEDWMSNRSLNDEVAALCRRLTMVRREQDLQVLAPILRAVVAEMEGRLSDDGEVALLPSG